MSNRPAHVLPETLESALVRLGRALSKGDVPGALLAEVLGGLGALPPQAVTLADAKVWDLAGLYTNRSSVLDLIGLRRPHPDLLEREPRLALLFLFHRDGHVREAALDSFGEPPTSPFFLAALALRLNDWARPVRVAARFRAERLFPATAAEVVVAAAPYLLDRWRRWGRWEQENASVVDGLLQRADVAAALVAERFANGVTGPLATELRYALRGPSLDTYLVALARNAKHPAVRATALQALLRGFASWPFGFRHEWVDRRFGRSRRVTLFAQRVLTEAIAPDDLLPGGLRDRSAAVRRVAADALIERRHGFAGLDDAIVALRRDPSPALRERAAFLARKRAEEAAPRENPGAGSAPGD